MGQKCPSQLRIRGFKADLLRNSSLLDDVEHYHRERNQQGAGNRLLFPADGLPTHSQVARRERVGGLLRFYHREAA